MTRRRERRARAAAKVIVPVRPANMRAAMTYLPATGSVDVMPVDRPQVAKAEMTSKRVCDSGMPVICSMAIVPTSTSSAPRRAAAIASRSVSEGRRLPKAWVSRSPRASATTARTNTAKVVTLIPPAADAEPPPMNMSPSRTSHVDWDIAPTSRVASPEDRASVECRSAAPTRSPTGSRPSVEGLFHSKTPMSTAPRTSRRR